MAAVDFVGLKLRLTFVVTGVQFPVSTALIHGIHQSASCSPSTRAQAKVQFP